MSQSRRSSPRAANRVPIVLAAAGLKRLGFGDRIRTAFAPSEMLPAAGQGALGIEIRAEKLAHGKTPEDRETILGGVRRLTDARAMGSLFKVMALAQPSLSALEGFDQKDPA